MRNDIWLWNCKLVCESFNQIDFMSCGCEVYKLGPGLGKRDQTGCGVWRSCLGQEFTFLFSGVMRRLDIRGFWDVMGYVI
jgi:hypothetical protein